MIQIPDREVRVALTPPQRARLRVLCARFSVEFDESNYISRHDLPEGWVAGFVGRIYVGVSPEGESHS